MSSTPRHVPPKIDRDKRFYEDYQALREAAQSKIDFGSSRPKYFLNFITDYVKEGSADATRLAQLAQEAKDTIADLETREKTRELAEEKLRRAEEKLKSPEELKLSKGQTRPKSFRLSPQEQNTLAGVKAASCLFQQIKVRQERQTPFPPALRRQILGIAGVPHLKAVL